MGTNRRLRKNKNQTHRKYENALPKNASFYQGPVDFQPSLFVIVDVSDPRVRQTRRKGSEFGIMSILKSVFEFSVTTGDGVAG